MTSKGSYMYNILRFINKMLYLYKLITSKYGKILYLIKKVILNSSNI